jgi:uncharacterized protein YraI
VNKHGNTLRKTLVTLLTAFAVLVVSFSTPFEATAQGVTATVNTERMNVRSAPTTDSTIVGAVDFGTAVNVDGRNRRADWVRGTAATGQSGWFSTQLLAFPAGFDPRTLPNVTNQPDVAAPPTSGGDTGTGGNPPPPPAPSGGARGGFELGGQIQSLSQATVDVMRSAGMTWVKGQAHAGDSNAFGFISAAKGYGLKVLMSVVGDKNSVVDDGYQNSYAGYVAQLAAAGADAIEVWNEPNIDREWKTGSISPAIYTNLLAKSYNAIKAANPNTIVITGAPAPTGAEGAFGLERVWNDDRYVAGLVAAGAGRYADCIGVHYNEGIVGPDQVGGDPRGEYPTRYFRTMLDRGLRGFNKPACFTELGYLTGEGYPPLPGGFSWASGTTVAQQAQWLGRAAQLARNSGRVRLMIVFNVDLTFYGEDPQAGFAIIRPGGACPACATLANAVR